MVEERMIDPLWVRKLPGFLRKRIQGRWNFQKILTNLIWLSWDHLFRLGISFLVGILVARYLGPTRWGTYRYAIAFVGLFVPLIDIGLKQIIIREIVRQPEIADEFLGTSFILKSLGAVVAILISTVSIQFLRPEDPIIQGMVTVISVALIFRSFDVVDYWFQSQVESKYVVIARNSSIALTSLLRVILVGIGASLLMFSIVIFIEYFLIAVALVLIYRYRGFFIRQWNVVSKRGKFLLQESWPLLLASISVTFYMQINIIILGQMTGDYEVGIYAAANRLTELWYFIPIAVSASVAPAVIKSKELGSDVYDLRMQRLFRLMTFFALAVSIAITVLGDEIIILVFGAEYVDSIDVLKILIWGLIFVSWGLVQGTWDVNEGLMIPKLARTLLGLITVVVLSVVLIPMLGAVGAAISMVIAFSVASFLGNLLYSRTRKMLRFQLKSFIPRKIVL
jgi:PST family polysaccharide transporter